MTMGSAEPSHVFVRGNHRQPAEQVECGFLSALPGVYETEADARRSRLALAAAMAKPDNPLSAQTEALDKARQLESQIQDAAQQQRQRIDEQAR